MTNTLAGRTAVCLYCNRETASEHASLLDYRGKGSTFATEGCGECGYNKVVHQAINPVTGRPGRTDHDSPLSRPFNHHSPDWTDCHRSHGPDQCIRRQRGHHSPAAAIRFAKRRSHPDLA